MTFCNIYLEFVCVLMILESIISLKGEVINIIQTGLIWLSISSIGDCHMSYLETCILERIHLGNHKFYKRVPLPQCNALKIP